MDNKKINPKPGYVSLCYNPAVYKESMRKILGIVMQKSRLASPYLLIAIILFILAGCTAPRPVSTPAVVTFKTPKLKVHDTAFVTLAGRDVEIEVYTAGTLVLEIHAGSMVCINGGCISDDEFTAKYLSPEYPARILGTIARKEPIDLDGKIKRTDEGFVQRIVSKGLYDITYSVKKNEVFFRDRANQIIIMIRTLD